MLRGAASRIGPLCPNVKGWGTVIVRRGPLLRERGKGVVKDNTPVGRIQTGINLSNRTFSLNWYVLQ